MGLLRIFLSLSPALVAGVSLLGGAGAALAGFMVWNMLVDNPQIWARADDACTIKTQDAADRAETAERARQKTISDAAIDAYNAATAAQERGRRQTEEQLETERARYELVLSGENRRCGLLPADIDWLRKQSDARDRG